MSDPASEPSPETQSNETPLVAGPPVLATRTAPMPSLPGAIRRRSDELLLAYAGEPTEAPAPELHAAGFVWGLAQPLLGLRMLWRHQDLQTRAVLPVLGFVAICLVVADRGQGVISWVGAYYLTLIGAAPLSPIVFARNYARLAAAARPHLGLSPRDPWLRPFRQTVAEAIVQLIIVGVGVAPLVGLVAIIPVMGPIWAAVLGYLWALHWIVVEALDSAKTLAPGHTEPPTDETSDPPWFDVAATGRPVPLLRPLRWWAALLAGLSSRWRGEIAIIQGRPWLAAGLAVGSALLLAIPVLNLLFRPAVVIAGAHVLGRLESEHAS